MPFAVSITKSVPFQGRSESFANVYQYGGPSPDPAQAQAIVDALVAIEKPLHSSAITFEGAFVWEIGGTPAENLPILKTDIPGTGSDPGALIIYMECAVMVKMRSTRVGALGKPAWFRKWYHPGALNVTGVTDAVKAGTAPLPAAAKTKFANALEDAATLTVNGTDYLMQTTNGGVAQLPAICNDYLEHRQFHRS
jgi:hypothetical protein